MMANSTTLNHSQYRVGNVNLISSRRIVSLCLILLSWVATTCVPLPAHAEELRNMVVAKAGTAVEKRVALVIGNGNYQSVNLPKLDNPPHDAEDIASALRRFGFDVIEKKDQSLEEMNNAIAEFGRRIGNSQSALFYYAGHGLQVKGQNYLIPINAKIDSEAQVPYQSININLILDEMENGNSLANIVMLDACRNNPITGKFRSGATRGLAAPTSTPKGTIIVYATDPGNTAADGTGRNGLFTSGLLNALNGRDLSLLGVLTNTSEEVERLSEKKQTPYVNGPMTLQKNFHFALQVEVSESSMEHLKLTKRHEQQTQRITPSPPEGKIFTQTLPRSKVENAFDELDNEVSKLKRP